jgi:hypothetical protein
MGTDLLNGQRNTEKVANTIPLEFLVRLKVCCKELLLQIVPKCKWLWFLFFFSG